MDGMIDVKSRRCAAEACNKYPAFNMPGENTARFCGDHRQPGMIDVHNKRCAFEGCQKRPTFNYVGTLAVRVTTAPVFALLAFMGAAVMLQWQHSWSLSVLQCCRKAVGGSVLS